jgi:hypothetical protein
MARLLVSAVMVLTTSTYAADESGHTSVTMDEVSDAADIVAEPEPEVTFPAAVMARVKCIETKESDGANVWNSRGSGAGGVLQYMPSTFARGAREMGHPEWSLWTPWQARLVAAHDLVMGRRSQWSVGGCN